MKTEKKKKEKDKYSFISNLKYSTRETYSKSKLFAFIVPTAALVALVISVYSTYQSRFIIDALSSGKTTGNILLIITGVIGIRILLTVVESITYLFRNFGFTNIWGSSMRKTRSFVSGIDYERLVEPETKNLIDVYMNNGMWAARDYYMNISAIIFGFATALAFGTLLSTLHPLIILGLAVLAVARYFAKKPLAKLNRKINELLIINDRSFRYTVGIQNNFENAKEMRIYNMSHWVNSEANKCLDEHRRLHNIEQRNALFVGMLGHFLSLLRDGFAYVYLIIMYSRGSITPGEFVMYSAAIATLATTLNGFAENFSKLNSCAEYVKKVRETEGIKSRKNHGSGIPIPRENLTLEFRHVYYKYASAADYTLKDINFKIGAGEKLAVVGMNGSGKTTLIRLLCGLFNPTEGEILLCGRNINDYNIDEYYSLFSAVFQTLNFMPVSIAEIVSTAEGDKIDRERVLLALEKSGLSEKIKTLENGIDTPLGKTINEGGIELSGGEMQKLALARAIYLDRSILVLDEPTAALDPIAENEMYLHFNEIAQNKTAVFISHRLASTRFCDRIIELDGGQIIEQGTHETLMAAKGKYFDMFSLQAQYYTNKKEDGGNEE